MAEAATGTPLDRWQTCISCHIEKDKGSPKLHHLCIIHIYEADFNMVLKLLWSQRLIHHTKYFFYHIYWMWKDPHQPIERKKFDEMHWNLGVRIVPNGSWDAEIWFLKSKAEKYSQQLLTAKLSSTEASIAYRMMFVPSLMYSAGVTWLSKLQCKEIQKIACPEWLQAMGYNRHFPIAVTQAPYLGWDWSSGSFL